MGKGSQLTQLKSAISQAGLAGRPPPSKKRKRTQSKTDQADKDKKAAKLKEIQQKLNPFDVKVTKLKHDVGGRKIKGVMGKPAQSRQAGIEERKHTLLKEYETKNHAGGIVDRRFGENDPSMSLEERMLERFTKERQRTSKGDLFNLEDDGDMELTHYGQSLSKLDDFEDVGLELDEDEEETRGQIDSETVKAVHFGGFEDEDEEGGDGEPPRKKSKAEVMAEVMAKSKEHKYRRQAEKEEDESLRAQLDDDFDSLRSLLYSAPTQPAPADKPVSELLGTSERDAEYDALIRALAFEARAKPKDRTKTEEELALEEKVRLEEKERRRVRRMQGLDSDGSGEEGEGGRRGKKRAGGGDDLEDDFYDEMGAEWGVGGVGKGLREEGVGSASEEEDGGEEASASEEEEKSDEEDEGEWVSDDGTDEDEEVEEGEQEDLVALSKTKSSGKNGKNNSKGDNGKRKELPYTFPAPETHEKFLEIVEDIEDEDVPTVIQRIRTLYHPSLAEGNKFKLQALSNVLIDHILYITSPPDPRFPLLSALLPHLAALTQQYPIPVAEHFRSKLSLMHKNLKRGLSSGSLDPSSKTWPGLPELSLLRVIGLVWPTSDMKHPVVSPARLLMGAYLGLARVRTLADVASGLFLCTLFLQYEARSKRFVPEAVNFAINAVLHLAPSGYKDVKDVPGWFPCLDFQSELCKPLMISHKQVKKLGLEVEKPDLGRMLVGEVLSEQEKVDLLALALDLLGRFAEIYKGIEGFIELYDPILQVLEHIESHRLPQSLKDRLTKSIDMLTRILKFSRQARRPLQLQAHKPIPIPSYVPKFESSSSNYFRNRDPDHERNEAAKLRRQYKQEKKGALRELRKDARFLAGVQQMEQMEKDKRYGQRMKQVFGSIESERAEQKAMEREKKREKKRAEKK